MNSILNTEVSCFRDYNSPDNPQTINLLSWLRSEKYADRVKVIRSTQDKSIRDLMKSGLPAITPSGVFTRRCASGLIKHSGFIQVDIDQKENSHIGNYSELMSELCKIPNVAYGGRSVSGTGYFLLIPIAYPEKHKEHFEFIRRWFADKGLIIDDKPKNPASLRGYSYDTNAYFNHNATPLLMYYEEPAKVRERPTFQNNDTETVEAIINELSKTGIDITEGYGVWFALGCDIAGVFGASGESYFHTISQNHHAYNQRKTELQYRACMKFMNGKTGNLGALVNACKACGVPVKVPKMPIVPTVKPVQPISLFISQITAAPSETVTTFDSMRLLYVKTSTGSYDLLLGKNGDPIADFTPEVEQLAQTFGKKFNRGYLDGKPALINCN